LMVKLMIPTPYFEIGFNLIPLVVCCPTLLVPDLGICEVDGRFGRPSRTPSRGPPNSGDALTQLYLDFHAYCPDGDGVERFAFNSESKRGRPEWFDWIRFPRFLCF
jgi:hypothetical protein